MKKLYKIIITCILFCGFVTAIYATTDILPENKFGIKKIAILGAGVFLIVQILFIAYQKDKMQEKSVEKEKKKEEKIPDIKNIETKNVYTEEGVTEELKTDIEISTVEELEKMVNEDKNLFLSLHTEKEIETLPDEMAPKKRNITLKKEITIKEKKQNIQGNKGNVVIRNDVKIVRERKRRNPREESEIKKEETKAEGEAKKRATKAEGESKKRATKAVGEAKKKETIAEGKSKKRKTQKMEEMKNKKQNSRRIKK